VSTIEIRDQQMTRIEEVLFIPRHKPRYGEVLFIFIHSGKIIQSFTVVVCGARCRKNVELRHLNYM